MAGRSHTPHITHVARGKFTHACPRTMVCLTAVVTGLGTAAVFIPAAAAATAPATAPAAGTVFIADTGHGQVVQVPPGGTQSTVPTTGLSQPTGVALDTAGDVYIADRNSNQVVEEPAGGGPQTTVPATGLDYPFGVAVDAAGDVYIADAIAQQVVEVTPAGVQTTVPATGLAYPTGVAVDAAGDVYIADTNTSKVVEVTPAGVQTTVPATGLSHPTGVAVDVAGDVYIADTNTSKVVEVSPAGVQTTVPATGLHSPFGVAVDAAGDVYITDLGNSRVVEVTPAGVQATVGTGLSEPFGVAVYSPVTADNTTVGLTSSTGAPLAGGTVSYYAGGWHTLGTTDSSGTVTADIPAGTYSFAMTYHGTRQQLNSQSVSATGMSTVSFRTDMVNVELQGSDSNGHVGQVLNLPGNGSASYYAGGWNTITTTNSNNPNLVQAQMLPGTYSFAATYNGTRDQKQVTLPASGAATVYFHAALVFVQTKATVNTVTSIVTGSASYYAGAWRAITTKDANNPNMVQTEMLPGTYSFADTYNGARQQKQATIIEPNANNGDHADQSVYFGFPGSGN